MPSGSTSSGKPQGVLDRLTSFATAPGVVYVGFVLTAVAGLAGRADNGAVLRSWPFYWGRGPISWWAVAFWSLGLASAGLAWLKERKAKHDKSEEKRRRTRAENQAAEMQREARDAREENRALSERLAEEVRTSTVRLEKMPPKDLLGSFDGLFEASYDAYLRAVRNIGKGRMAPRELEDVLEIARVVLFAATSLVQKFEKSPSGVVFSANVMLFRPIGNLKPAEKEQIRARLRFHGDGRGFDGLQGVLDAQRSLSVLIDGTKTMTKPVPDLGLPVMSMPVFTTERSPEQGWLVLPGAPQAFCSGDMDVCPDVDDIIARCDQRSVYKHLSGKIREHLSMEVPHIKSFVSLPLERAAREQVGRAGQSTQDSRGHRLGVVNINSSRVGLLADPEVQELLLPLLRPILWMVADLTYRLDRPVNRSVLLGESLGVVSGSGITRGSGPVGTG